MIVFRMLLAIMLTGQVAALAWAEGVTPSPAIAASLPKVVKIYGAGGVRGLEPYQSGFLISADGHVLTAWSYVLDTDEVTVTLDDGRRYAGTLVGADPRMEIAVLKIDAAELAHFDLAESVLAAAGTRVLALSNLFGVATGDEPVSVQRGVITAATKLDARRGAFATAYQGPIYVLDAMTNNPGAAGGALVNNQGQLLGMLGKELRSARNRSWLNYALPTAEIKTSAEAIIAGKPRVADAENKLDPQLAYNLSLVGVTLVPNVLEHTPPFIDDVRPDSPAYRGGLRRDDLLLFIGDVLVPSCRDAAEELARIERDEPLRVVVKRGQELVEAVIDPQP